MFKTTNLFSLQLLSLIYLFIHTFKKFFENLYMPDTVLSAEETKMRRHGSCPQEVYNLVGKQIYPQVFVMTYVYVQNAVGLHHG